MTAVSPFAVALGADFKRLAPAVRRHLAQARGASRHRGRVRAWRRGGLLGWLLARPLGLAPAETSFELRNELREDESGSATMVWRRSAPKGCVGLVRWDPRRGALVDATGPRGMLQAELLARVDGQGALALASGRQWLRVLGLRVPLPRALVGGARVREREEKGAIVLSLALFHPWLGEYAGYEATLQEAPR
jgi:hypothetical protein